MGPGVLNTNGRRVPISSHLERLLLYSLPNFERKPATTEIWASAGKVEITIRFDVTFDSLRLGLLKARLPDDQN